MKVNIRDRPITVKNRQMTISVDIDEHSGQILMIYISLCGGEVARTMEVVEGTVMLDKDADGESIGVEILASGITEKRHPTVTPIP